jgi:D-3-phosphoglycerate dehydrogenase
MGSEFVPLDQLLRRADIVSVHVASTPQTRHLVSAEGIASMQPGAILINTARGPVVDEAALAQALTEGRIAGAGLDVFDSEPPLPTDAPILTAPHTVLTPHVGFATAEALATRAHQVFGNIAAFSAGKPCQPGLSGAGAAPSVRRGCLAVGFTARSRPPETARRRAAGRVR